MCRRKYHVQRHGRDLAGPNYFFLLSFLSLFLFTMTDSSLDSPTTSHLTAAPPLSSSQHAANSDGISQSSSMYSSLPSLPSLPPLDLDTTPPKIPYTQHPSSPSSSSSSSSSSKETTVTAPHRIWGPVQSCLTNTGHYLFKDNNLPLLLNVAGHLLTAKRLCRSTAVTRYTTATTSSPWVGDLCRHIGALHLSQACLAALVLKDRQPRSTERSALWVLAFVAWVRTYHHIRGSSLYTWAALQDLGATNATLAVVTSIALRNTIQRTGKVF